MRDFGKGLLLVLLVPSLAAGQAAPGTGDIRLSAALVDGEMQVRPVPLHALRVITAKGDTIFLRTGLDGAATAKLPSGTHRLESVAPQVFQGRSYAWSMQFETTRAPQSISLTNDNAAVSTVATTANADAAPERATELFDRLSASVFRVEVGVGHGTGFLADTLGGVVITNAHVVERAEEGRISISLDSVTRVRAQLLAVDPDADVAVLRITEARLQGRYRVPLQRPVGITPITPGERLMAMGFPLSQDLTITSGIASSIRAGAVISDVNINPGNSGGPLLNAGGEAVAINTFGDGSGRGPGVSGSVLISRAGPALARAAVEMSRTAPPSPSLLPMLPREPLNITTLKAFADTVDPRVYRKMSGIGVGGFEVTVQTPAQTLVAMNLYEADVGRDRKKREERSNLPESQRFSTVREYRDWSEYVGHIALPVVSFAILPKVGETTGSLFARVLVSASLQATYKFRADVRGATVFRDQVFVEPIKGGHMPMMVYEENRWVSLKDVADQGYYVFDPELLRPALDGTPPSIVLAITDLKDPKKLKCREFSSEIVANAWNDFELFYEQLRPGSNFVRADAKLGKNIRPAWRTDFLKKECDWSY